MKDAALKKHLEELNDTATSIDVYQDWVKTAVRDKMDERYGIIYGALKLSAEAGEVANIVGKLMHDDTYKNPSDKMKAKLFDELGDVLWYFMFVCNSLGVRAEEIADYNISKIETRYGNESTKEN